MGNVARVALGAWAVLAVALGAEAGVTLNSARVGGPDVEALGKFYQAAFGLKEVNRLSFPGGAELFFNFGDSVDAAKANTAAQIVIMHTAAPSAKDPVPHLIFNVTDAAATAAAVQKAGGTMDGDPKPFGNTGIIIGIAIDPAGNRIELIQRPAR
ncbi:MAG TPA: VOC family protein [Gammaproteobacteria bacterium]|nr:VOC family protein [Gammaproteobacteria bacterium]